MWWECSDRQRYSTGFLKGLEAQVSSRCLCWVLRAWKLLGKGVSGSFCEHLPAYCFASAVNHFWNNRSCHSYGCGAIGQAKAGGNLQSLERAEKDGLKFSSSDRCRYFSRTQWFERKEKVENSPCKETYGYLVDSGKIYQKTGKQDYNLQVFMCPEGQWERGQIEEEWDQQAVIL